MRGAAAIPLQVSLAGRSFYFIMKRSIDLLLASLVCVAILSWMIPLLAVLIPFDTGGTVFFLQKRKGKKGRSFLCIKFRTMVPNVQADRMPAAAFDHRITKLGHFLRKYYIDELPQFINVLAGQMSVVGPRPHMIADCNRFSVVIDRYDERHQVKPGITGMAQMKGYHGAAMHTEAIYKRYCWDIWYVRNCSAVLDFRILLGTFVNFFRQKNTYSSTDIFTNAIEYPNKVKSSLQ